jgi:hypothetical protein
MTTDHAATGTSDWIELDHRTTDGLEISVLWNPTSDQVRVAGADPLYGKTFEFGVSGPDALAAFHLVRPSTPGDGSPTRAPEPHRPAGRWTQRADRVRAAMLRRPRPHGIADLATD